MVNDSASLHRLINFYSIHKISSILFHSDKIAVIYQQTWKRSYNFRVEVSFSGVFTIKQRRCLSFFFAKCPPKWKKTIKKMILLPGRSSSSFPRDVLLADILLQLLGYSNLLWWIVGCSQGHFLPIFYSFHFSTDRPKKETIKNQNEKNLAPLCL
jgi:hypothetical protein